MKTRLFAVLPVLAVLVFAYVRNETPAQQAQPQDRPDSRAVVEAMRNGGVRAAARLTKHFITSTETDTFLQFAVEDLTKFSSIAVIGEPVSNVCRLSADGETIYTDYTIKVLSLLKGKATESITVSGPGGKLQFDDGTSAEVQTPGFRRMENGKTYLLFLYKNEAEPGVYRLTGKSQGLFSVVDGKLKPHAPPVYDITKTYEGADLIDVTQQVVQNAAKWPRQEECCGEN